MYENRAATGTERDEMATLLLLLWWRFLAGAARKETRPPNTHTALLR